MILLVSGASVDVAAHRRCGVLVVPRGGNSIDGVARSGRSWAADNDCFQGLDVEAFWRMVTRISDVDCSRFLWVSCPDVVGQAQATVNRWIEWYPQLEYLGLPAAFVAQDGLELIRDQIPWDQMAAFFVGGSTGWKMGEHAESFVREAKARGKLVHVGRVNSAVRVRHAVEIGADSIDGSGFSKWPKLIRDGLRWIDAAERQPSLF